MKRFRYAGRLVREGDFVKQTAGLCSAASIANACRVLGVTWKYSPVTEAVAALAMGLSENAVETGADQTAIVRGVLALGFKTRARKETTRVVRELYTDKFAIAQERLKYHAVIASVDGGAHWLVLVADGARVNVIDSDNTAPMLARITPTNLERRWRHDGKFYGIALR